MIKLASWNVNSVRARLKTIEKTLTELNPDIICLQEIKCQDEAFPYEAFESLGYNSAVYGQKSYNGVAILSKYPFEDIQKGFLDHHNQTDEQARYLETIISIDQKPFRIASIYVPNGNPAPGIKFDYKLDWLRQFYHHAKTLLSHEEACILAGDYNIIPEKTDVYSPEDWQEDALFRPESRAMFRALKWLGYTDAFEAKINQPYQYTFWDYQAGAFKKNNGIRIDHILTSPIAADLLKTVEIHKAVRGYEKPSDHVPISAEFKAETG